MFLFLISGGFFFMSIDVYLYRVGYNLSSDFENEFLFYIDFSCFFFLNCVVNNDGIYNYEEIMYCF